jgi:hypothetical protein
MYITCCLANERDSGDVKKGGYPRPSLFPPIHYLLAMGYHW